MSICVILIVFERGSCLGSRFNATDGLPVCRESQPIPHHPDLHPICDHHRSKNSTKMSINKIDDKNSNLDQINREFKLARSSVSRDTRNPASPKVELALGARIFLSQTKNGTDIHQEILSAKRSDRKLENRKGSSSINGESCEEMVSLSCRDESCAATSEQVQDQISVKSSVLSEGIPFGIITSLQSYESVLELPEIQQAEPFSFTDSENFRLTEEDHSSVRSEFIASQSTPESINGQGRVSLKESSPAKIGTVKKYRFKCKTSSPTNFCIVILCLSLIISLYFAIFGSPVAFRNFFNSLTDERKKEVSNELKLKYASASGRMERQPLNSLSHPKPFAGISYSPQGSNEPFCEFTKEKAIRDIALISTLTQKIRTYGTQCNQTEYILHAIQTLKLDIKLTIGVWLSSNTKRNTKQIDHLKRLVLDQNIDQINSVFIGNEVLQRGDLSESDLISHISDVKSFFFENDIDLPVGTSEDPSFVSQNLVNASDVFGFTIQPFLAGITASDAAQWSVDRFAALCKKFGNGKTDFTITEIGWPFRGGRFKEALASPQNHQKFVTSWVKDKAKNTTYGWYFYEAFNEPWKIRFNTWPDTWESEWGLFDDIMRPRYNLEFAGLYQR